MKILQLDASDLGKLDQIHKTKGTTRYVYPPFGVSQHSIFINVEHQLLTSLRSNLASQIRSKCIDMQVW